MGDSRGLRVEVGASADIVDGCLVFCTLSTSVLFTVCSPSTVDCFRRVDCICIVFSSKESHCLSPAVRCSLVLACEPCQLRMGLGETDLPLRPSRGLLGIVDSEGPSVGTRKGPTVGLLWLPMRRWRAGLGGVLVATVRWSVLGLPGTR